MEKLKELRKEYAKFREWGYNKDESAERAVQIVFKDKVVSPYIHKDSYSDPSHIFYQNHVLFFDGRSIYTRQFGTPLNKISTPPKNNKIT